MLGLIFLVFSIFIFVVEVLRLRKETNGKKAKIQFAIVLVCFVIICVTLCFTRVFISRYDETTTFAHYDMLVSYSELAKKEDADTLDTSFYEDIIAWNSFVKSRQDLTNNVYFGFFTPDWFHDLKCIEVPTNVTFVENLNYMDFSNNFSNN